MVLRPAYQADPRGKSAPLAVRFGDGEVRDDIYLDCAHTPMCFDAAAYHAVVKVQYNGSWFRGRLVELIKGIVEWGVRANQPYSD